MNGNLDFSISLSVKNNSDEVMEALHRAEARILEMWGINAQGNATEYAPYDTGNLRSSIGYKTDIPNNTTYIGTDVEYAPYQEFGTYKMEAHPFLKPALADHLKEYEEIVIGETAKELK